MTREEVKYASKDYINYLLDKQEYYNEKYTEYDIKQAFEKGAEWADKNPNSKTIAEYLYKEKGYPISLNGDIPTYEEVAKHVQAYNNYKMRQKACDGLGVTDTEPNLKILWHDASEEPQDDLELIIYEYKDNFWFTKKQNIIKYHDSWKNFVASEQMLLWAYVKDLFPKENKK